MQKLIKSNHNGFLPLKIMAFAFLIILFSATILPARQDVKVPENISAIDSLLNHAYELDGKVVYVDFWASWCAPCQQSFPWMNDLKARYAKQGLQIITINLDKDPALARKFIKDIEINLPVYYDSTGSIAKLYDIQVMPTSYIYDSGGSIYTRHQGFKKEDREELEAIFDTLLKTGE